MLNINKDQVRTSLEELCTTNHVTMSQLANFIFKNFFVAVHPISVSKKIKYHGQAIVNLTDRIA